MSQRENDLPEFVRSWATIESAPRDGTWIYGFHLGYFMLMGGVIPVHWDGDGHWEFSDGTAASRPSHWHPLPHAEDFRKDPVANYRYTGNRETNDDY
jgi:hypothetical protein